MSPLSHTPGKASLDPVRASIEALAAKDEESVPKLVDTILESGAAAGASDIHIESRANDVLVRFRMDGQLVPIAAIPRDRASNVFARLKLLSRVVTYKKRSPQDGRLAGQEGSGALRAAFMPTLHGEKAVLRLPISEAPLHLEDLGLPETELARLQKVLRLAQGTILLTGPCSSGKSTSIYALLRHLLASSPIAPNIASLEDPIEQEIEGVNQTQVDLSGGLTFLTGLRTLLRMDPNVIVVGEIRDEETAHTVIQAGLSGHLVISTVHGGSSAQVYARLLHMNMEPFLVASSLNAIVAQRLLRSLCLSCRQPRMLTDVESEFYFKNTNAPEHVWSAVGCAECGGTGYSGRTAVFEIAVPGEEVREAVMRSAPTAELHRLCMAAGMVPLVQAGALKAASGETSMEEIARVIG